MNRNYEKTIYACFVGYIVQAIVNNFVPLLFLIFEKTYHIPLGQITMLITINFGIQLLVDLLSAKFVDNLATGSAVWRRMSVRQPDFWGLFSCRN